MIEIDKLEFERGRENNIMTKEERAKKWFLKIPDAEYISLETKMNICSKVAKKWLLYFSYYWRWNVF